MPATTTSHIPPCTPAAVTGINKCPIHIAANYLCFVFYEAAFSPSVEVPLTADAAFLLSQQWREAKEGDADVMALDSDDDGVEDDEDGSEGNDVSGDELFNRCINNALEMQEVCRMPVFCLKNKN